MTPNPADEKHEYLVGLAGKLDDPDAYLRFLEAKLERVEPLEPSKPAPAVGDAEEPAAPPRASA